MKNTIKLIMAASALALLTACGGGGSDSPSAPMLYGAIAMKQNGGESGVVGGQNSQANANTLALNQCGSECVIVETFVGNKCARTAYATGPLIMAWAVEDTETAARNQAMINCANAGGRFCTAYRGACNVNSAR
jgi:hypothetical protein